MNYILPIGTSTPTETGSIASEDTGDSSTDTEDGSEDSDDETSDDNETNTETEEDGDEENEEQNEETEINEDSPLSPRALSTRARGHVRINLWNLDKK